MDGSVASCHWKHKSRPLWHMLVFLLAAGHILHRVCMRLWVLTTSCVCSSKICVVSLLFPLVWSRLASDDSPLATPAWLWTANSSGSRALWHLVVLSVQLVGHGNTAAAADIHTDIWCTPNDPYFQQDGRTGRGEGCCLLGLSGKLSRNYSLQAVGQRPVEIRSERFQWLS